MNASTQACSARNTSGLKEKAKEVSESSPDPERPALSWRCGNRHSPAQAATTGLARLLISVPWDFHQAKSDERLSLMDMHTTRTTLTLKLKKQNIFKQHKLKWNKQIYSEKRNKTHELIWLNFNYNSKQTASAPPSIKPVCLLRVKMK